MTTLTNTSTNRRHTMKDLEPKYAARAQARARLDYATDAVERAKRLEAEAAAHVHDLESRAEEAETHNATELAVLIANGGPTAELPAAVDDGVAHALATAIYDHNLKARALATLKRARDEGQTELAAAERAVVQAVDQILGDEIAERARQVEHHLDEALRLGVSLKYFAVAAGIHATGVIPAPTQRVLDRLEAPPIDLREIPINLEKLGDVAAFREWTARRDWMIAGDAAQEDEAA
jgi:hypothetical protein